ncbi:MAG: peptidylprolyl isomerase, partial [Phototrophicaceae bacterium]
NPAIAIVNGEVISRERFLRELERRRREAFGLDEDALETFVLTGLIHETLTAQAAARMGILLTDDELNAELTALQGLLQNDAAAWSAWLEQNGYTEPEFSDALRAQLLTAKVRDSVVGDVSTRTSRQVHARHILVETEAQAQDIAVQLQGGASFVDLAAQYSRDVTTRDQGGDLGWFTPEELLEPIVAEVAFAQPIGGISAPVVTRLGYHIIQTLEFDELPLSPEKQAEVAQAVFDEWLSTQTDSAMIEIYQ